MTQEQIIIEQLKTGSVSRNWALRNYISRLGAIICRLNKQGWVIKGNFESYENGMDYVYRVIKVPPTQDTTPESTPDLALSQTIAPEVNKDAETAKATQGRLFKPQDIIY